MDEDGFEVPRRTEYRYLVQDEEEEEVQYARRRHYISPFLVLSKRCIFLICLGVLALLALAVYLGYMAQTLPPGLAQVLTQCGEFRGRHVSVSLQRDARAEAAAFPLHVETFTAGEPPQFEQEMRRIKVLKLL